MASLTALLEIFIRAQTGTASNKLARLNMEMNATQRKIGSTQASKSRVRAGQGIVGY